MIVLLASPIFFARNVNKRIFFYTDLPILSLGAVNIFTVVGGLPIGVRQVSLRLPKHFC